MGTSSDIKTLHYLYVDYYTEKGDYIEMTEEQPSETQKWIISLRKNNKALLDPIPNYFTGGFVSFPLSHVARKSPNAINKFTKHKNWLIVSFWASTPLEGKTLTQKINYTCTKIIGGKETVTSAGGNKNEEKEESVFSNNKAHYDDQSRLLEPT